MLHDETESATPQNDNEAVIRAIDHSRMAIAMASFFGFASISFYGITALYSDRLNALDTALSMPLALLFLLAIPLYLRWPADRLLSLLHGLIIIASLGFAAFFANSLFGSTGGKILDEEVPVLLAVLPIQIVFIYTYLRVPLAHIHAGALLAACVTMTMVFAVRHPAALQTGAWYWVQAALLMTGPMCIAFLGLQAQLHSRRLRALGRATTEMESQNAWLQQSSSRDFQSEGLNEQALTEALANLLRHAESPRVLLLDIEDFDRLRLNLGAESIQQLLQHLARELGGAMGPGTRWGRWRGRHFVVWNPQMPPELFEACAGLLEQVLQEADLGLDERVRIRFGQASAERLDGGDAEAAVHDMLQEAWHAAWPERTGRFS